jgi:hypothetical protein
LEDFHEWSREFRIAFDEEQIISGIKTAAVEYVEDLPLPSLFLSSAFSIDLFLLFFLDFENYSWRRRCISYSGADADVDVM